MTLDEKSQSTVVEAAEDWTAKPLSENGNGVEKENGVAVKKGFLPSQDEEMEPMKWSIKWFNVVLLTVIHLLGLYSLTYLPHWGWRIWLWNIGLWLFSGFGTTAGAHRLWTHRCYKATLSMRICLMILYCMLAMNPIFDWVRDHRVHHKYSETDADPHNAKRGLFFSHVGWLLVKKHPEVIRRGKQMNMDDILNDPVCAFDKKYHIPMVIVLTFVIPTAVPMLWWNEPFATAATTNMFRYVLTLNGVFTINSIAHTYGSRPFNKDITPGELPIMSFLSLGECWHNYHHVFPWDYKAAELTEFGLFNITKYFIEISAHFGFFYDLKSAPEELVRKVAQRFGDGTYYSAQKTIPEITHEALNDINLVDIMDLHAKNSIDIDRIGDTKQQKVE